MPLSSFHPVTQEWFTTRLGTPTDVQVASWPAIRSGKHALISAPTGSGKTLAAFLTCIDTLLQQGLRCELEEHIQVVYVSPLKALSNDIQKNLQEPLAEITERALSAGLLTPALRVEVRTGDTPPHLRQRLLRHPPHILITTPESLFLLLTARKSRDILHHVRTVIVDEIHALAPNKRGAHLALSLERLEALCQTPPVRIGLSATQRPLEETARFLVGGGGGAYSSDVRAPQSLTNCHIIDIGHRRPMDLGIEVPNDELGAVATNAIWSDIYDRVADYVRQHRATLVFVNTRRLAERVAHHLAERLGKDHVASHHGSLSRKIRLAAEHRLKTGQLQVMVATASLELGIDIGHVDLVCQIGSPRAIATCIQRVGRAGHWVGAIPKGRLFCTTRDELVECAAVVHAMRQGRLDQVTIPSVPIDILAQHLVAEVAGQEWSEQELFDLCVRAYPYRHLHRQQFDRVIHMLAEGYVPNRRRQQAFLFHDRIHHRVRPRRGARLAALTSGGAIPDAATYSVIAEPEGTVVGTVDEDFAVESMAGDIILLGTSSWRIRGVETGKMRVEDAHGAPPTIPFWRGEAPSRTAELSHEVAFLREHLSQLMDDRLKGHGQSGQAWLQSHCGLNAAGAEQIVAYLIAGKQVLGAVPTQDRIIAERFFDEAGGMQLVIHSPFGGQLNRAWGLALRKRFCVNFDFELQAAATDEGLVISLGEKHSFPLDAIFSFLHSKSVREVLIQSLLGSPLFLTRWRWNASRALALLRFQKGKKVPLHIQRMRAEDLLTAAFPLATACQDNHIGDIPIPDHPLVQETVKDCLTDAMDVDGLIRLLLRMEEGKIQCLTVESPSPSPFAHEILNANPYAFLDDAPLEERRARAVNMRQSLPPGINGELGTLDPEALAGVIEEAWPTVRDSDELHDTLHLLFWVPEEKGREWDDFLLPLVDSGRAMVVDVQQREGPEGKLVRGWVTSEQYAILHKLFPQVRLVSGLSIDSASRPDLTQHIEMEEAMTMIVRGWLEVCGPITSRELAFALHLPEDLIHAALVTLEGEGQVLRGHFRPQSALLPSPHASSNSKLTDLRQEVGLAMNSTKTEWCNRRLLARIHRRTVVSLRREIEPVAASDFMRFLFRWQHRTPGSQLHGESGLREVIIQLAGFEAPASAWEPSLLKERMSNYQPVLLDNLCLRGELSWGRLVLPYKEQSFVNVKGKEPEVGDFSLAGGASFHGLRRINPTSLSPISFFLREDADWIIYIARKGYKIGPAVISQVLSAVAREVLQCLESRGASFFADLKGTTGHLPAQIESALWELVAGGLVTADGYDNLRALVNPKRRRAQGKERIRRPRHSVGRWDLLVKEPYRPDKEGQEVSEFHEKWGKQLLRRYGVVFRDLIKRESVPMTWRELLLQYRRMEWRGEIRGGRFVHGFSGEQYALPEAIEALRAVRRDPTAGAQEVRLSPADPLNLLGVLLPGERVSAHTLQPILFRNGVPISGEPAVVTLG